MAMPTQSSENTPQDKIFIPVVLCGGSGTRLWPLSRSGFPKQFLCLTSKQSLFQETLERLLTATGAQDPVIICNEEHRFLVQSQLNELSLSNPAISNLCQGAMVILEPEGRNTAPALTLAALACLENESPMFVTPADQAIGCIQAFQTALEKAVAYAYADSIVTLGVKADRPETGYGYIKAVAEPLSEVLAVEAFVEKPSLDLAQKYLDSGDYFWNAGMFVLKPQIWIDALRAQREDILLATQQAWLNKSNDQLNQSIQFIRPSAELFKAIPAESIDYAVMEGCPTSAQKVQTVPLESGWSDLGAWDAVWDLLREGELGNAFYGDVLSENCKNTLVHANNRLVGVVGLENIIVIETADAVLVADSKHSQEVKGVVDRLRQEGRDEQTLHRKVDRPWGWYDSIDQGDRFKVKRIQVNPGASLSLQKHHHRAEHWIVVKGTAEVTVGERVLLLSENQSTYIPLGEVHRLRNPGSIALEIIEVQSGSYLGEDDIVRYEDRYGRIR